MYTGIVNHCGKVIAVDTKPTGKKLTIACDFNDLAVDESIAVNGTCVTITDCNTKQFSCDLSHETLRVTNLGLVYIDSKVNLERSLRAMDRMGGHSVNGLIDQVGQVASITKHNDFVELWIKGVQQKHQQLLIEKSDVCVNGVSLTIHKVKQDQFQLIIIPHTLAITNLNQLTINDAVNLEFDIMIKSVANVVKHYLKQEISGVSS